MRGSQKPAAKWFSESLRRKADELREEEEEEAAGRVASEDVNLASGALPPWFRISRVLGISDRMLLYRWLGRLGWGYNFDADSVACCSQLKPGRQCLESNQIKRRAHVRV